MAENMTLERAKTLLHIHCTSSHNPDWKEKREAWAVVCAHLAEREAKGGEGADAELAVEWANIHESESNRYLVNKSFTNARRHREIADLLRRVANPAPPATPQAASSPEIPDGSVVAQANAVQAVGHGAETAKQIRGSIIRRLNAFHESNPSSWCGYLDDALGAAQVIAEKLESSTNSRQAVAQPHASTGEAAFQARVSTWMDQCFLPSLYSNMTERGDRLLEEVLELLQAHGYDRARVAKLVDYVYDRPVGVPAQEVGGVMVTLAGFCWIAGLDMQAAGEAELARINQPEVMAKIRAKQEAKNALQFDTPLPGSDRAEQS